MKKVVLSLAVLFAAALVSCGGNKEANAEEATTDTMPQTEEPAPAAPVDTPTVANPDSANAAAPAAAETPAPAAETPATAK